MNTTSFLGKVFRFTEENSLFSMPCHVLLGLSGGADSMALLYALTHWPTDGLQVSAVHIHHGLRTEADDDEAVVRNYCTELGVPLTVIREDNRFYMADFVEDQEGGLKEIRFDKVYHGELESEYDDRRKRRRRRK